MANPFRKLPAGSPVTAFSITAYNRMIDMLNWWQTVGGGGRPGSFVDWDQTVFRCRNDTGDDLASYAVVGIGGPIWSPSDGAAELVEFHNQTSMKGVEPTVASHLGRWGVMLEATPDGAIGRCCLTGVVPLRVYCTSHLHRSCDAVGAKTVTGETVYVGSGHSGSQILWWEAASSGSNGTIVSAIVRLGQGRAWIYGKLKADLLPDDDADIDVYAWSGSAWADAGWDLTVFAPPLLTAGQIDSGKWVRVEWCEWSRRMEVVSAEC